jgi:hypothetical protein
LSRSASIGFRAKGNRPRRSWLIQINPFESARGCFPTLLHFSHQAFDRNRFFCAALHWRAAF